ncbi:MAG: SpoIIE family protein phosphatase [bacterium]|nr:SpoIIE family protein phosphatase [bacterium]
MFRRPVKEIDAEFLAEEKYLDSIRRVVKESCAAAGMARKDTAAVLLAIEEGATNIIRHAYLYERGVLRLRVVIYQKLMAFSLIDTGRSFQPQGSGKIDLERLVESGRKGGLGFYMIQKIMDSVEYISSAEYNELRMFKRISPPARIGSSPLLSRMTTLRAKFSFWTFFIVFLIVGTAFYFINDRSTREVYQHLDGTVSALGKTISQQAAGYIINNRSDVEFDELLVSYVESNEMLEQVVLVDIGDVIVAHSDDIRNIRKQYEFPDHINREVLGSPQRFTMRRESMNYLILPIQSGERVLGKVLITYSSGPVYQMLEDARWKIIWLTGALLLIGIVGIYLLSNYFVTPILKITERVRRFSQGDLETELPLEGADEFFEISRALNDMTTRLSRDRKNIIERERMAKEIEVASQIQKTLLPREIPTMPGLEVGIFYRAASVVGGDLYDIFPVGEDQYCLVVADVSGKGVPASLVMSMLRTVIRIYAERNRSARETLLMVNEYLVRNMPAGMFITVQLVIYQATQRQLQIVSAGHNPMLFFEASRGQAGRINPSGMPVGVDATLKRTFADSLEERVIELRPNDVFFLFTDGLSEATDRTRKQYGMDRLSEYFQQWQLAHARDKVADFARSIVDEIDNFSGLTKQSDDITFIVCRVQGESESTAIPTETVHSVTDPAPDANSAG